MRRVEDCRSMASPNATAVVIILFKQRQPKSAVVQLAWQNMVRAQLCAFGLGDMQNCKVPILAGGHDVEFEGWRFLLRETAQIRS